MIKDYLKRIAATTARGDAREESYYSDVEHLLLAFSESIGKKKIKVTVLPKKTEAGNPDFRVWDGEHHVVGYIEAKKPGTNLDQIEVSDQLRRYRGTFPNLILTDFYEFRLYRDGTEVDSVSIGRPFVAEKLKTVPPVEHEESFNLLLEKFFAFTLPKVYTAKSLAEELAKRTRFLKEEVVEEELREEAEGKGDIFGFFGAFKEYLIAGLTTDQFADLFSQTLTYGLFAARTRASDGFNRKLAYDYIPPTIGILRDVFRFVSSADLPKQMEVIVDDIAEVLHVADVNNILDDYYRKGKGQDPIVHFYETFLAKYDPTVRERRGVYYTPEPVVRYIVRSLHQLLKTKFGLDDGLAAKEVTLLDPAGGTLTFPVEAIKIAVKEFVAKYGEGGKHGLIKNQILKNTYAFELMMAPYAIGHLKASFMLEELGYTLEDDDRFNLYLTNTLDMEDLGQSHIPGLDSLSEESRLAGNVKKDRPILVISGNPPYSGISANAPEKRTLIKKGSRYVTGYLWDPQRGKVIPKLSKAKTTKETYREQKTFIGEILMDYYFVDGEPLGEKKLWLQDDYVKFLRFAQWKIEKAGHGIVGMITNHSYLDNPTFRGMRQSLMQTFDEIYILDLHGNSLKKEVCPDGSPDQNVFDIRQGVAIALFVKTKPSEGSEPSEGCAVSHAHLWGRRSEKYNWLEKYKVDSCSYEEITPKSPWYFFIPRDVSGIQDYLEWPSVRDVFPLNVTGIVTARDGFIISFTKKELENRIFQFRNLSLPDETIQQAFKLKNTRGWKLPEARKKLAEDPDWKNYYKEVLYRPFDVRQMYYTETMVDWGRPEYMRHMLAGDNIGLVARRQQLPEKECNYFFVSDNIISDGLIRSDNKGSESLFPLYLYPEEKKTKHNPGVTMAIFEPEPPPYGKKERQPNITPEIVRMLKKTLGRKPTPERVLYYIYAVFYSNIYREKYAEFLKIDFPRVPFTSDREVFYQMADLGKKIADLHLLKSSALKRPSVKYAGTGTDDTIEKPVYMEEQQRVYINSDKYFSGVKPEVWNYHIGGYHVLHKFLKDRKGRQMDDPRHYCRVVTALEKTIGIQREIDEIFPTLEKSCLNYT